MNFYKKLSLLICLSCVLLLNAGFILAFEVDYSKMPGLSSINDTSTIGEFVCAIFGFAQNLAISIAGLSIVFGGVYYLVSYGRGKFTSEAKDWIKAGITGLLLVVCAFLIMQTINPNLNSCKIGVLSGINFNISDDTPGAAPGVEVVVYQEIPIGILTENLLTRKINCYGFDQEGNPVNGGKTDDELIPTYTDHDRADCLVQLADGAQKKSQVIASLSDKIIELMNKCDCKKEGSCDPTCGGQCGQPTTCPGGTCIGPCVGGSCEQSANTTDCCPDGVKELIEHGPISMTINILDNNESATSCQTESKEYKGLDEFRSEYNSNYNSIKNKIKKTVLINKKQITVIDIKSWHKLKLIDQLAYFQGEIDEIKKTIKDDKEILEKAENTLSQCYLATPYVDLLKAYESTDQSKKIILTQKIFSDPETKKEINTAKYCNGFNYANSSCFKKCNDICPDTSEELIQAYAKCTNPKTQKKCIEDAYNARPCKNTSEENPPKNFSVCISSCQNTCTTNCEKKYLPCSDEYNFCTSQCGNNSQCVLDNAEACLLNANNLQQCAKNSNPNDPGNTKFCINNSYWCKNGSDQYAGYADCIDTTIPSCSTNVYSSSFLYESFVNSALSPSCEKCSYPYEPAKKGTACYSSTDKNATCQNVCPETTKCPSSSFCPDCPCDQISNPDNPWIPLDINFSVPNVYNKTIAGAQTFSTNSQPVLEYQMVGPQCNEYSYNDDPLTFYCQENWLSDPNREGLSEEPIGTSRFCPQKDEIPVGQMVDNAESWAENIIKPDKLDKDIKDLIEQMTKAGEAKDTSPIQDYCKCSAKLENGNPICKTDCQYNQWLINIPIVDKNGKVVGNRQQWQCSCTFLPCSGNPCKQVIDYLVDVWNTNKQLKSNFVDFYMAMLIEPRSDIIKQLTYSRKTTNSCSLTSSAYELQTRLLNCTRVKDEITPPFNTGNVLFDGKAINVGCYGQDLGFEVEKTLMDNWFCCEEQIK